MSRGGNSAGGRGTEPVDFTFYVGLMATYESGMFFPIVDERGEVRSRSIAGGAVNIGAYGSHSWRRSSVGVDYRGDYRHYPAMRFNNGSDHAIGIEYRNIVTRRWEIAARQMGGTTTRPIGGFTAPTFIATDYISAPLNEIYNNRFFYSQTALNASYRMSARTSAGFSGGLFRTHRQSRALVNTNGYTATAGISRLITRTTSVGVGYNYMKFQFPRIFGGSDIHGGSLMMERSFGRYAGVSLSGGMYRLETLGTEQYALRPEIAAILGRATGTRVLHRVNYMSQATASVFYRRRQMSYNAGYSRGAVPGNGVYLTSQNEVVSAGVSYSGVRRASFGANTAYSRMNSLFNTTQKFTALTAGGGFSYNIGHGMNYTSQFDWRRMNAGETILSRSGWVVSMGFAYSTSRFPLSLW